MKQAERDELLIRVDERTQNIWRLTEKQEEHLSKLNDQTSKNTSDIIILDTKVDERTASKISKKAIAGYSGGGLLVLAITILQIIQMFGG